MAMAYATGHTPTQANLTGYPPGAAPGGIYGNPPSAAHEDIPALIAQLATLRDRGAISQAEFETKREELLRRL
jgi:hypothetical protein